MDHNPFIKTLSALQLPSWNASAFTILVLFLVKLVHKMMTDYQISKKMPPGPPGLPFVGHLFQWPKYQWHRFSEWKEQYGDMFSLNLVGQRIVVLNSLTTAADLFDRRSNIYSDRPRVIVAGEILTGNLFMPFLPASHGDRWHRLRRAAKDGFTVKAVEAYQPIQEKELCLLLSDLLRDPHNWASHYKRTSISTVLNGIYGLPLLQSGDDEVATRVNDWLHRLVITTLPGSQLVDTFPILNYLPDWMVKWKRIGRKWFREDNEMFLELLSDVRKKLDDGKVLPCFGAKLIEEQEKYDMSSQEIAWVAGTMFGGGSETTSGSLEVFTLAMVLNPDVMRCAQAQIDEVVGPDRLPSFSDRDQLPYIIAIVMEVIRWKPVAPLSMPRIANQDDWYNGYLIPKGTIMIPNIWAINRDAKHFPEPDSFRPERYLDEEGNLKPMIDDTHSLGHVSFGFGRRICVGREFANESLFIKFAALLWGMTFEMAVDNSGERIVPDWLAWKDEGIVVRPAPFQCVIKPRSARVAEVVDMMKHA